MNYIDVHVPAPDTFIYKMTSPLVVPAWGLFILALVLWAVVAPALAKRGRLPRLVHRARWGAIGAGVLLISLSIMATQNESHPSSAQVVASIEDHYGVTYLDKDPDSARPGVDDFGHRKYAYGPSREYRLRINTTGKVLDNCVSHSDSDSHDLDIDLSVKCNGEYLKDIIALG